MLKFMFYLLFILIIIELLILAYRYSKGKKNNEKN